MKRFVDLKVWQRGHTLVLAMYRLTKAFPSDERYGITSQIRRAAVSVPTNIAEGSKRTHATDYAHFLNIAQGSLAESEYLTMLSRDLEYLSQEVAGPLLKEIDELARMLHVLRLRVEEGS